mgnify:CR=1 FL=1
MKTELEENEEEEAKENRMSALNRRIYEIKKLSFSRGTPGKQENARES